MHILGPIILAALLLLTLFALANWATLTASTAISFVVFDTQGPLGVILLGVTLVLVGLFALYALSMRTSMLMESRRHNQEMQTQRKLAESAEASRLKALHEQMEHEFTRIRQLIEQSGERVTATEQSLRNSLEEAANGLAANLGEIEDKLDRALAEAPRQI